MNWQLAFDIFVSLWIIAVTYVVLFHKHSKNEILSTVAEDE